MSQHYNVYVFTAGTFDYAEPIVNYLNQKKKTILGLLHRKNCMETQNGFFIKDLRIIQNRELKDIVMVDNLVHSFGLQITNGIPILEFLDNKLDRELQGVEKMLIELSIKEDVRDTLEAKLKLKEVVDIE
jgi:CTD small phosphatase-like protein 2